MESLKAEILVAQIVKKQSTGIQTDQPLTLLKMSKVVTSNTSPNLYSSIIVAHAIPVSSADREIDLGIYILF